MKKTTATLYFIFVCVTTFWEKISYSNTNTYILPKTYILCKYMDRYIRLLPEITVKIIFNTEVPYCSSLFRIRDYFKIYKRKQMFNESL